MAIHVIYFQPVCFIYLVMCAGIDSFSFNWLQTYLSDEEFKTVFGLTKETFYQQPKWKQDMQKRKLDLFQKYTLLNAGLTKYNYCY